MAFKKLLLGLYNTANQQINPSTEEQQQGISSILADIYNRLLQKLSARVESEYLFSQYEETLADGAEIDSGWMDMEAVDKYQFEGRASAVGMTRILESSAITPATPGSTLTTTVTDSNTFELFNVPPRQRYMRFRWKNTTGGPLTDVSLAIKGTYGSSDKHSVISLSTQPVDFSQSVLTQSMVYGFNELTQDRQQVALSKDDAFFVANANRLSEVKGREHVQITQTASGSITAIELPIGVVPVGQVFWMTDIELVITTTVSTGGFASIKDGNAGGSIQRRYALTPGTNQTTGYVSVSSNYQEPVRFNDRIHLSAPAIGVGATVTVNVNGYLEPL